MGNPLGRKGLRNDDNDSDRVIKKCIFPLCNYGKLFQIVWLVKGVHMSLNQIGVSSLEIRRNKSIENFLSSAPVIRLATNHSMFLCELKGWTRKWQSLVFSHWGLAGIYCYRRL